MFGLLDRETEKTAIIPRHLLGRGGRRMSGIPLRELREGVRLLQYETETQHLVAKTETSLPVNTYLSGIVERGPNQPNVS